MALISALLLKILHDISGREKGKEEVSHVQRVRFPLTAVCMQHQVQKVTNVLMGDTAR
jgi:hypothetical protein